MELEGTNSTPEWRAARHRNFVSTRMMVYLQRDVMVRQKYERITGVSEPKTLTDTRPRPSLGAAVARRAISQNRQTQSAPTHSRCTITYTCNVCDGTYSLTGGRHEKRRDSER